MNLHKESVGELELLRRVVDTVPSIIYVKSKETTTRSGKWTIEWMNSFGRSLLGYTQEELKRLDTDIYSGQSSNNKAESIVSLKSEEATVIHEEATTTLWRFYTRQGNKLLYCMEQSEAMPSDPGETIVRRVVTGQIFTPEQLNQPQLSILLRQICHTRHQHNFDLLTKRESEVMGLILKGKTDKEIGELLHIGQNTAKKHRNNILQKLGARNTAQLVALASEYGITY
jgi:DNA-binding CsgD family transcriptional regulator